MEFSVEICVLPSPKSGSALPGVKLFGRPGHKVSEFSGVGTPAPAQDMLLALCFYRRFSHNLCIKKMRSAL